MEIVPIFADVNGEEPRGLFSVRLTDLPDTSSEFENFFEWLNDPQEIRSFFKEREHKLKTGHYKGTTLSEAVLRTFDEAMDFEASLKKANEKGIDTLCQLLFKQFKPLVNTEIGDKILQQSKSRGEKNNYWIRIYAIKVASDFYILTGGCIKLVKYIDQETLCEDEVSKLNRIRDWLIEKEYIKPEQYKELFTDLES